MVNNRTMRPCLLARFRLPRMLGGGKTTCCSYSSRGASSGRGPNSTTGFTVVPFLRCNVITCFPPVQLGRAGLLGCPELHHETGSSMTSGVSRRRTFSTTRAGWNSSTTAMNRSPYQYKQGQYNAEDPSVREYFYFVDHNGMVSVLIIPFLLFFLSCQWGINKRASALGLCSRFISKQSSLESS